MQSSRRTQYNQAAKAACAKMPNPTITETLATIQNNKAHDHTCREANQPIQVAVIGGTPVKAPYVLPGNA